MKNVERPQPSYNRPGADQSQYCAFHDGPRHTANECWDLRDSIKKFIREGKLRQYVIETQGQKSKRKQSGRDGSPILEKKKANKKRKKAINDEDEFPEANFECN